ncbi:MAG: sigma 54-interacting transcriptional regulator [Bacillota bacterium]
MLRQFKDFIDSLYNGAIIIDENKRIVVFNRAACRIFNIEEESALGQIVTDVLPNTRLPMVLETGEASIGVKFNLGEVVVLSNHTPIRINQKIAGAIAIFQDISDLEKVSHQLKTYQELAAELNAIFENSYDGIYVTDASGKTLRVNNSYQRITGLTLSQVLGKNMRDIVSQGLISESITFKILKLKKTLTIKQTISTGKEILVTGTPIMNEKGEIIRVVTNVRDMTELNNLQKKLEQSLELKAHYERELSKLRNKYEGRQKIIAQSKLMHNVVEMATRLSRVDATVLILGESGVGKELIAQLIHDNSARSGRGAFIKLNCGAIPGDLLESELFGYEEGAFTGARKGGKAGLFEIADGGTIFLDEIADFPLNLQVKLLRVLQEGELTRLGGTNTVKIDVRLISATNKDLKKMVQERLFREDLYYRLNVVPLTIPPLRDRKEDILALIVHYLNYFNKKYETGKSLHPNTIDILLKYHWPGNARELINTLERLVVTMADDMIFQEDLPSFLMQGGDEIINEPAASLEKAVCNLEKLMILKALKEHKSTRKAAEALKISQSAVIKKAKKHGIRYDKYWDIND